MPLLLADRFGGGPFLYMDAPADARERVLLLMGIEGEIAEAFSGEDADEHVFYDDDDD